MHEKKKHNPDQEWFIKNREELKEKYPGMVVAIKDEAVCFSSNNLNMLGHTLAKFNKNFSDYFIGAPEELILDSTGFVRPMTQEKKPPIKVKAIDPEDETPEKVELEVDPKAKKVKLDE